MTSLEVKAIEATKEAWNAFMDLPIMHPDDQNEFRYHIHAIQNIILAREGQRVLKGIEDMRDIAAKLKNISIPSLIKGGIVKGNQNCI